MIYTSISQTGFRGTPGLRKGLSGFPRDDNA